MNCESAQDSSACSLYHSVVWSRPMWYMLTFSLPMYQFGLCDRLIQALQSWTLSQVQKILSSGGLLVDVAPTKNHFTFVCLVSLLKVMYFPMASWIWNKYRCHVSKLCCSLGIFFCRRGGAVLFSFILFSARNCRSENYMVSTRKLSFGSNRPKPGLVQDFSDIGKCSRQWGLHQSVISAGLLVPYYLG